MLDEPNPLDEYIGRFVCYEQLDGGACWGRIKAAVKVNTIEGEKDSFILADRYVRYTRNRNLKAFRRFYPDIDESRMSRPMELAVGPNGEPGENKAAEFFHEVRKVNGDSTLRVESIDLDRDVVDADELLDLVDSKTLFEALLVGRNEDQAREDAKEDEVIPSKNRTVKNRRKDFDGNWVEGSASDVTDGGSGFYGRTALEIGLRHLIRENDRFDEKAREGLGDKLGIEIE